LPNNYLQEILHGFSFEKGPTSNSSIADSRAHPDLSDGEYQILEESSDEDVEF
jgi:hypothetical protein